MRSPWWTAFWAGMFIGALAVVVVQCFTKDLIAWWKGVWARRRRRRPLLLMGVSDPNPDIPHPLMKKYVDEDNGGRS
jgi:hypothetical protein